MSMVPLILFFKILREGHPRYNPRSRELKMHQMIELENDIDLMFDEFHYKEQTKIHHFKYLTGMIVDSIKKRLHIRLFAVLSLGLTALLSGSYYYC